MFTGLVKTLAPVLRITRTAAGARLTLDLGPLAQHAEHGDSISVSGVCLTLVRKTGTAADFDVVPESLARSTLASLRPGDKVNLEPSLCIGDPLGGHFVLGHVDAVGAVETLSTGPAGALLAVSVDPALAPHMVPKGSIAVDGVSLTLVDVDPGRFTVALIPTTLAETTIGLKRPGDKVNIETDILGKLVARQLAALTPTGLTLDKLRHAGYV